MAVAGAFLLYFAFGQVSSFALDQVFCAEFGVCVCFVCLCVVVSAHVLLYAFIICFGSLSTSSFCLCCFVARCCCWLLLVFNLICLFVL